jgi:tetratricopeptide (TPR) repeat protein
MFSFCGDFAMSDRLLAPDYRGLRMVLLLTGSMLLTACASHSALDSSTPEVADLATSSLTTTVFRYQTAGAFAARPLIPDATALHRLTPAQLRALQDYLNAPENIHLLMHERVFNYLKLLTDTFAYYGETLSASEALARQSGNCLTLAILTTALAEAAGVEIDYQLLQDVPVFEYEGRLVVKGVHLRSILYQQGWTPPIFNNLFVQRPGLKVDYFPSERERFMANVKRAGYLAMYYHNRAVEALEAGRLNEAYWFALEALQFDPNDAAAINTLAITHRRAGLLERAEALYQQGLAIADDKLLLLKNYRVLLEFQGRRAEARQLAKQLESFDDPSPYHWLQLAQLAESEQDYATAARYYHRVIDMAPYMHEAHLGLALADYHLGRLPSAVSALREAVKQAAKPATRRLYEAKLAALQREQEQALQIPYNDTRKPSVYTLPSGS